MDERVHLKDADEVERNVKTNNEERKGKRLKAETFFLQEERPIKSQAQGVAVITSSCNKSIFQILVGGLYFCSSFKRWKKLHTTTAEF